MTRGGRIVGMLLSVVSVAALLVAAPAAGESAIASGPAKAIARASDAAGFTAAEFDPGNIISDANFYDGNAMTAVQVQAFLDSMVGTCSGSVPCLKNLRVDTWNIAATPMCAAYSGAASESAATIIHKVGRACGVSQAAILVMLQKEQGLVTNPAPSLHAISAAMGVGCYDDGNPCVGTYAGFFNQLFNGAYLLRRYTQPAGTGSGTPYPTRFDLSYPVGQTSQILYHPNRDCGTKPVTIQNQATHALYVYTPYTPNAAALGNLYGTGDGCSSYGNRNFWRLYYSWFGNPTAPRIPFGWLDAATMVGLQVTATGWAIDQDTVDPIGVEMSVDGVVVATGLAGATYPGLSNSYPGFGDNHGFQLSATLTTGVHTVCVTAVNNSVGGNRGVGCRSVSVAGSNTPFGWLDSADVVGSAVTVRGWALDSDTAAPINVDVLVDGGTPHRVLASAPYANLGRSYPGFGDDHGFVATVTVPVGKHTICVRAINDAAGQNRDLGCRQVTISDGSAPIGWLDYVALVGSTVTATGWAIDPDTAAPIDVQIAVDGAVVSTVPASTPYAGLGQSYRGYGDDHGFSVQAVLSSGRHTICVSALNDGAGGNRVLGCREVNALIGTAPFGWLDAITIDHQVVSVRGWTIDPDTADPIQIDVLVDGVSVGRFVADESRPDVGSAYRGYGAAHGFLESFEVPTGVHEVCVVAINDDGAGANRALGCRQVTATSRPPFGWLDSVTAFGNVVSAVGWSLDPDTTDALDVVLLIDGQVVATGVADRPYPGLDASYPGYGNDHGYKMSSPATVGTHTVCVSAVNDGSGSNRVVGCKQVVVRNDNSPFGWIDRITTSAGSVTVAGWAFDPDTILATQISVVIDGGAPQVFLAGETYVGLDASYPGFGDNHGFDATVVSPSGVHRVCITALDDRDARITTLIGCATVNVP